MNINMIIVAIIIGIIINVIIIIIKIIIKIFIKIFTKTIIEIIIIEVFELVKILLTGVARRACLLTADAIQALKHFLFS